MKTKRRNAKRENTTEKCGNDVVSKRNSLKTTSGLVLKHSISFTKKSRFSQGDRPPVDRFALAAEHFFNFGTSKNGKRLFLFSKSKGIDLRSIDLRSPRDIFSVFGLPKFGKNEVSFGEEDNLFNECSKTKTIDSILYV